jgi:homocysteine S-methyltransferase
MRRCARAAITLQRLTPPSNGVDHFRFTYASAMSSRFEERLRTGPPIVADGGMGTLLSGAVPRLRCPEEANLRSPESVVAFHASFIRAGAELIETNTFGANRRKLGAYFLEDEFERINSTGVRLAREAREVSGVDVFIGGSIGPLGEVERFDAGQSELFAEQARVLEGRGVDVLMLETFFDLEELVAAIESVRAVSSLPVVALMTFDADGQTLGGVSAEDAAERLAGLGVAAAGANHSAGPAAALNALAAMQREGLVLAALPNVGLASLAGSRVVFPHATPDYFAEFAAQARRLGAGIIGGCCGTTPAQITAIRTAIEEERAPAAPLVVRERELAEAAETAPGETTLARMLREQQFVVSVQLDPPLGANNTSLIEAGRTLKESGKAHFVDVNDNPRARARMSGVMASVAIERAAGIETIPHLTTRDMSVAGLESLLLGAHAEGVHNLLAVTGDPPEEGDYPGARGVYEVDAIGLTRLVSGLNRGEDYHGRGIDAPTSFFVGVAVNPSADDLDLELERFERKLEAGAQFGMTQVLFDLGYLDSFLAHYGGRSPIPLLVGVWPLPSHQLAVRIHNEVPGMVVPEPVQERLRAAGADAGEAGRELARELIAESREKAAGVYLVAPFRRPLGILDVL